MQTTTPDTRFQALPWSELRALVIEAVIEAERELCRRVAGADEQATEFFFGLYSAPILNYVGRNILHLEPVEDTAGNPDYTADILTDYYQFLSKPVKGQPWRRLLQFESRYNAHLRTYLSYITVNHFLDRQGDYNNLKKVDYEVKESVDVVSLINSDSLEPADVPDDYRQRLSAALEVCLAQCSERERLVIQLLYYDGVDTLTAFDRLLPYLRPQSDTPPERWPDKMKQDAVGQLRRRTEAKLKRMITQTLNTDML